MEGGREWMRTGELLRFLGSIEMEPIKTQHGFKLCSIVAQQHKLNGIKMGPAEAYLHLRISDDLGWVHVGPIAVFWTQTVGSLGWFILFHPLPPPFLLVHITSRCGRFQLRTDPLSWMAMGTTVKTTQFEGKPSAKILGRCSVVVRIQNGMPRKLLDQVFR